VTLKQEIIKLIGLNAAKGVRDAGFSSPYISIRTRGLIRVKSISESTKYVSQLFISILTLTEFGL